METIEVGAKRSPIDGDHVVSSGGLRWQRAADGKTTEHEEINGCETRHREVQRDGIERSVEEPWRVHGHHNNGQEHETKTQPRTATGGARRLEAREQTPPRPGPASSTSRRCYRRPRRNRAASPLRRDVLRAISARGLDTRRPAPGRRVQRSAQATGASPAPDRCPPRATTARRSKLQAVAQPIRGRKATRSNSAPAVPKRVR